MDKLSGLQAIGLAERKLALKDVMKQKNILQEFRNDQEVAKAFDYLERFNEVIPDNHPIFAYVEKLREKKEGKEIVQEVVRGKTKAKKVVPKEPSPKEKDDAEEENRRIKKMEECQGSLNAILDRMEIENDKAFEYLSKNLRAFAVENMKMSEALKLKRFLISVKNGIRSMRIK